MSNLHTPQCCIAATPKLIFNNLFLALVHVAVVVRAAVIIIQPDHIRAVDLVPDPDDHVPVKIHEIHATVIPSHRTVPFARTAMEVVRHQNDHIAVHGVVHRREMVEIEKFLFFLLTSAIDAEKKKEKRKNVLESNNDL